MLAWVLDMYAVCGYKGRMFPAYTRKNAQVVTSLQTSYKLLQICSQAVNKLCSHCLFPVVVTGLDQAVNNL
jgi:hypothetical protein